MWRKVPYCGLEETWSEGEVATDWLEGVIQSSGWWAGRRWGRSRYGREEWGRWRAARISVGLGRNTVVLRLEQGEKVRAKYLILGYKNTRMRAGQVTTEVAKRSGEDWCSSSSNILMMFDAPQVCQQAATRLRPGNQGNLLTQPETQNTPPNPVRSWHSFPGPNVLGQDTDSTWRHWWVNVCDSDIGLKLEWGG